MCRQTRKVDLCDTNHQEMDTGCSNKLEESDHCLIKPGWHYTKSVKTEIENIQANNKSKLRDSVDRTSNQDELLSKSHIELHMQTHSRENPNVGCECNKGFTKSVILSHIQ